ncbi:MAG TPA: PHB depolymerase family esterase [Methylomirabilota bacterium]|nr:PHB depolymerase family esterase [Methylomirabilota bacterium]
MKRAMVWLIAGAWSVTAALTAAAGGATQAHTLEVGGLTRSYLLHVPPTLPAGPAPLVLVFHGGGGNGPGIERLTRFSELADREGVLIAYPEGVGRNWYDGREFSSGSRAHRERIDDVGFVAALLDVVARAYAVDPRRIYATGISNGAVFSHYLAAHLSPRIAAIAPVVGGIADPPDAWLRPERPVSVLILQGTTDPLVPYRGGAIAFGRGRIIDTEEAARRWARLDGAAPEPRPTALAAPGKDHCGGLRLTHSGGRDGSEVVLVRLDGGGHTWPGGPQYLPEGLIGRVCRDFSATAVIWEFFRTHPKP